MCQRCWVNVQQLFWICPRAWHTRDSRSAWLNKQWIKTRILFPFLLLTWTFPVNNGGLFSYLLTSRGPGSQQVFSKCFINDHLLNGRVDGWVSRDGGWYTVLGDPESSGLGERPHGNWQNSTNQMNGVLKWLHTHTHTHTHNQTSLFLILQLLSKLWARLDSWSCSFLKVESNQFSEGR